MKRFVFNLTVILALIISVQGCKGPLFSLNLNMVGEKTALEKQVLGNYNEIGRSLDAYASVRGVNPDGTLKPAPEMTASQYAVLQAMNNRRYNRDDLDLLLTYKVVGENKDGILEVLKEEVPNLPGLNGDLARTIIEEENIDRNSILDRLIQTTPGVGKDDRPAVASIFAGLNQQLAPIGSMVQFGDGSWREKK